MALMPRALGICNSLPGSLLLTVAWVGVELRETQLPWSPLPILLVLSSLGLAQAHEMSSNVSHGLPYLLSGPLQLEYIIVRPPALSSLICE